MKGFRRNKDGVLTARFENDEIAVLASLVEQLVDVLTESEGDAPVVHDSRDPFAAWEADFAHVSSDDDGGEVDPVMERLFPDAYRDDAPASAEFRRFTRADQLNLKVTSAGQVISDLQSPARGSVPIPDAHITAWLTTLTNLRLAMAVRLGIERAEDADLLSNLPFDDPRGWLHSVYEWLGWVQEAILEAL